MRLLCLLAILSNVRVVERQAGSRGVTVYVWVEPEHGRWRPRELWKFSDGIVLSFTFIGAADHAIACAFANERALGIGTGGALLTPLCSMEECEVAL